MTAQTGEWVVPQRLTVLFDEGCALCRRARDWLLTQPCYVEVEMLAAGSDEAMKRYGQIPARGKELVVVDERGNTWIGPSAFLACMWATARWRAWSFRLARPSMQPHAERFFRWVSSRRDRLGRWVGDEPECSWCEEAPSPPPRTAGSFAVCEKGHPMGYGARFGRTCGAPLKIGHP